MRSLLRLLTVLAALAAAGLPALAQTGPTFDRARVERAVARLRVWGRGRLEASGTGFVVNGPGGKRWIVTSAHVLAPSEPGKPVTVVQYLLPGMRRFADCGQVLVEERHDLALLQPDPSFPLTEALPVLGDDEREPALNDTIYTLGSPGGLDCRLEWGRLNANPVKTTVGQIARDLVRNVRTFAPLDENLVLWQHGMPLAAGCSGSPVLTASGKVIGVASSVLPGAPHVSFGVHVRHLRDFNGSLPPRDLETNPVARSAGDALVSRQAGAGREPPAPRIRFGTQEIEAPLLHLGYVEADADRVIRRYVQDQKRFRDFFTAERLQAVLDSRKVAHLSNPVLGFRLLAPRGYSYTLSRNESKDGVVLELSPPASERVISPYNEPITVAVFHAAADFEDARKRFARGLAARTIKAGTDADKWVFDDLLDRCTKGIVLDALRLRVRFADGTEEGSKENPVYLMKGLDIGPNWARWNLDHPTEDLGYAVHVGLRDPIMAVTTFKFRKSDREAYIYRKPLPPGVAAYGLISSTVSLY